MNDPEFKELTRKALFAVAVALVFAIPLLFIFINKFSSKEENELLDSVKNKETFMLYIIDNNCSYCKTIKKELDKNEIIYKELNKDKESDYNKIISSLELNSSNIYVPTLIYVEKGEVISYIVDINSEERLKDYLNDYN